MDSNVGMKHPAATSSFTSIPLVDMGPLQDGGAKSRVALAEDICQFCETVGFLYIVNHGIPQTLIADMFRVANEFFALPAQEKMKLRLGGDTGFRGYLPAGIDGGTSAGNRKEAFQIIREVANPSGERGPRAVLARPNLWPDVQPVFRQTVLEYFAAVEALADTLLRLFAIGLGVAETTFTSKFQAPVSMLRLLHYPPQASMEGAIGSQPHTDTGALTILAQDDAGGLEAVNDLEQWTPVEPIDGSLVVNLGGMMKLWSDGRFSATPHRVINMSGKDRISIPYFASPDFDTVISPVISAKTRKNEMQLVGHLQRDETASSGELLLRSWNRLWGPAVPAS
jgi:isopenicillin N synthase-like dioxygenase